MQVTTDDIDLTIKQNSIVTGVTIDIKMYFIILDLLDTHIVRQHIFLSSKSTTNRMILLYVNSSLLIKNLM